MKSKETCLDETALSLGYDNFRILLIDADSDLIINSVASAMEQYANQSKWIDVETDPPKVGEHFSILVWGSYTRDCPQRATEVHFYKKGKFIEFRNMDGSRTKNVTHWQPLPPTP